MSDYAILLRPIPTEDGGGWLALVPDLAGCQSDGETKEEAITNVLLAIAEWVDVQVERGAEVPPPGEAHRRAQARFAELKLALDEVFDGLEALVAEQEAMVGQIAERDSRIMKLERKHRELVSLLQDETGRNAYAPRIGREPKSSMKPRQH